MSITHFGHEHPLFLLKQVTTEEGIYCNCCQEPLLLSHDEKHESDVYGCEICESFFLHKSCAHLPMEIVHKSHKHSLFLLSNRPAKYSILSYCDLCDRILVPGFFYHCYLCDFDLDIKCALKKEENLVDYRQHLTLHHPSHKHHPLILQPRPTAFVCDACDVKEEDLSYQCLSCHYMIHRRCANLPSPTNHEIHPHPLSLSFGLPSQYHIFNHSCDVCEKILSRSQHLWLYFCHLCRYFVHIKCMETKKPEIIVDAIPDLLHLPTDDKPVELIQRFLLKNNNHPAKFQDQVSIFSHKHPLLYSNEKFTEDDIDMEDGEEILCDACIEPISSPPYYHCAECRYFLHLTCAMLSHELQHPSHLDHHHPLILSSKPKFYDTFHCNHCKRRSNGFFYYCRAQGCEFYLDVKCAALPTEIEHEFHNHPLFQMPPKKGQRCRGCDFFIHDKYLFGCEPCKFYLHGTCVLLPKTTKHRFDSHHPLKLRFPPHSYHPKPFDCAECETEMDPNNWLYHCEECDLSFHINCLNNASWRSYNCKFGQRIQITSHLHPLKFVYRASVKSPCQYCGIYYNRSFDFDFECETCNFHLCRPCVLKILG